MENSQILRVVVASPSDVQTERNLISTVTDELNRGIAGQIGVRLEVSRWETDAFPGFHPQGPQGLIDPVLRIEDCDIFIGIFWKRFGSPVMDAGSGTEHEFLQAYNSWKINGRPQIMFYFNQSPYKPQTVEEATQWGQVIQFQKQFPPEGLWWPYKTKSDFERLARNHLTQYLRRLPDDSDSEENEDDEPEIHDEETVIAANEHEIYYYDLEVGDEVGIAMSSDAPVDLFIMSEKDYEDWHKHGQVNNSWEEYISKYRLNTTFVASEAAEHWFVLCNRNNEDVTVDLTIQI